MSVFEYEPLGEDEIRLLEVYPGKLQDEIVCRLFKIRLSDEPVYAALSYVWGPKEYREIRVNGNAYKVTKNLHYALQSFRTTLKPVHRRGLSVTPRIPPCSILWVDAICINQSDIAERSQQVRLMFRVYSQANAVLVSLSALSDYEQDEQNLEELL